MAVLDEWNDQITGTSSGTQFLRLSDDTGEAPLFGLDHRAEFLSQ